MCLDAMSGSVWFSTIDLRSSYPQVPVDIRDRDMTVAICREGSFRVETMPFGLYNTGATFQRLTDVVMSGLSFGVTICYLHDCIVYSRTFEEHFDRLRFVLTWFTEASLKLKPSKCFLLQTVSFLGHILSDGKLSVRRVRWRLSSTGPDRRMLLRKGVCRSVQLLSPFHRGLLRHNCAS